MYEAVDMEGKYLFLLLILTSETFFNYKFYFFIFNMQNFKKMFFSYWDVTVRGHLASNLIIDVLQDGKVIRTGKQKH